MNRRRNDDTTQRKVFFRSERIFRANGQWYFHTREGIDVGPFSTEFEAQVESSILKSILKDAKNRQDAIRCIQDFLADLRAGGMGTAGTLDYGAQQPRF